MKHELKTESRHFDDVLHRGKTFELRFNDRDFQVGDILQLRETRADTGGGCMSEYTGRVTEAGVSHILRGPVFGLVEGWVILSLRVA